MEVSIIVSPRERFTSIIVSLQSLFATIPADIPVIVVEGCSPESVCEQLKELQEQRPFEWIRTDYFITPQEARNIGFDMVQTELVVFTDNDIHYQTGWLEALISNREQYDSDLVAPLICIGPPEASIIHHAGGRLVIKKEKGSKPHVTERHRLMDRPIAELSDIMAPNENEIVEFHCFLARSDYIRRVGPMDERLITREQIDFGLRSKIAGCKVTFEKSAVVTYMAKVPFEEVDLPYMVFRWSDELATRSLQAFTGTWEIETETERVLNRWIRPHRFRAFSSAFPKQLEQLGRENFIKYVVSPKTRKYIASAFATRTKIPDTRFPQGPGPKKISLFFDDVASQDEPDSTAPGWIRHSDKPMIIGGMATMPSRMHTLWPAIASILPQLDRLYLFFDRFDKLPSIRHPKIIYLTSQSFGDHRANGKFLGMLFAGDGDYYFSLDDDILYPRDYVERMTDFLQRGNNAFIAGVHGARLKTDIKHYLTDRDVANRRMAIATESSVHILGTCTTAFNTDTLRLDVRRWKHRNMVDLTFALICTERGIPLKIISREENWVGSQEENQSDSIFSELQKDDTVQTTMAKALQQFHTNNPEREQQ
ncbi:glycosyltransferase family 2 protein [Solemya velum gill symbiont]|uniref:Glycosyltransferase 2-like domain-containing protein n=2 Tax=Solemya velum gill symbiont TaxID=2340 RepID=A0A1T2CL13_SOVGS|nr:glycosyltransferase [Solemya velum gill symbiont]OOY35526.1 hypothetical protein BOV88_04605 [Solemya velum gill symbiont]OOY38519.1 hypothetical protein BOV89_01570 [Solemya velum gill symbiont]OOY40472.1 hypothetical protein BOV90_04015 [Solemya velum gill symbiont]OOY48898.1 hypothetical protein BOV93_00215 [Solemya velum gill symbiont]OOY50401.1 hypothetical protein BOV94_07720 [Solemya velum gill symbiont]